MFGEFVMPSAPAALIVAPDHVSSMGNPAKAQIRNIVKGAHRVRPFYIIAASAAPLP